MKQILTHDKNIKKFKDISRHVELEADRIVANQIAQALLTEANPHKTSGFKHKKGDNGAPKQGKNSGGGNKSAPKKNVKRRRGKKRGTNKVKCFNDQKKGHFAHDCTEPKKVTNSLTFSNICVCSHVLVAHSLSGWIVDIGATKHVARDRVGYVDYRRVPRGTHKVFVGNGTSEDSIGVGLYQLHLSSGRTLLLHDILHVPRIQHNLLSVTALISFGFSFEFSNNGLIIFANGILYGHRSFMDGFIKLDLNVSSHSSVNSASSYVISSNNIDSATWHARLGHIGKDRMTWFVREGLLGSLTKVDLQ